MRLADVLTPERVSTTVSAADKEQVLRGLAQMFTGRDPEAVYRVFQDRELLASTGIGSGVAIPHGRMAGLDRIEAALAICREGVDFDAVDGLPARIFVAVIAPERHTGDHLKTLARISRLLRRDDVRQSLLDAADPAMAYEVVVAGEDAP